QCRLGHNTPGSAFFSKLEKFIDGSYTHFVFAVAAPPDRQRSAPETRPRQIPIHKVLQPIAEAAGSGRFRLPVYGLVQSDHLVLQRCGPDKPRIERVVQHRLVSAPAMRISVLLLLDPERFVVLIKDYRSDYVRRFVVRMTFIFVGVVLDIKVVPSKRLMRLYVVLLHRFSEALPD